MKTFLIMIILVLTFSLLKAPVLDDKTRAYNRESSIKELERQAYEKEFMRFATHLSYRESRDWTIVNQIGCMGLYQFTPSTLRYLGYGHITPDRFRRDPGIFPKELQFKVLVALVRSNEIALQDYMEYEGSTINKIRITKSGMLGGAHLGGARSVMLFLQSGGRINKSDINGTTVQDYIKEFSGYNL